MEKKLNKNIYLKSLSPEEALKRWLEPLDEWQNVETIDVKASMGRVTSDAVFSKLCSPAYNASAMDGICLHHQSVAGANESNPVKLKKSVDFEWIDTGDPVDDKYNSVIMVEEVNEIDENTVIVEVSATPYQYIRTIGESLVKGQMILPSHRVISPYDIGLMLEGGLTEVKVFAKPRVEILPTGTEIVEPGQPLKPGDIIEYNSAVVSSIVESWGGVSQRHNIIKDDYDLLCKQIDQLSQKADLVVVIAGSSAGREDFTAHAIAKTGKVCVHGANIKPGGPVILGIVNDKPVIGLPGYPVASALTFKAFCSQLFFFKHQSQKSTQKAVLAEEIVSSTGYRESVRVKLAEMRGKLKAFPLARSSGAMSSLCEADGLAIISEYSEGINAGTTTDIELENLKFCPEKTLIFAGSHDMALDILKDIMKKNGVDLVIKTTGSMGGITSLKNETSHIGALHLFDPETGTYNKPFISKYLDEKKFKLVNFLIREQGIIVAAGNPKKISSVKDLVSSDVSFVNRQRGSGTRVLFDHLLKTNNIKPSQLNGYSKVQYTHPGLAALIANGMSDAGIGIRAAAQAFNLDFIPVAYEQYDFLIPEDLMNDDRIKVLINAIRSDCFIQTVNKMAGYKTEFKEMEQPLI